MSMSAYLTVIKQHSGNGMVKAPTTETKPQCHTPTHFIPQYASLLSYKMAIVIDFPLPKNPVSKYYWMKAAGRGTHRDRNF